MTKRRKPKSMRLSEEDRKLWAKVCATVNPMTPAVAIKIDNDWDAPQSSGDVPTVMPLPLQKEPTQAIKTRNWPQPSPDVRSLAKATQRAVSRGTIVPDRRIDLHGDRFETARQRLIQFIHETSKSGNRVALVITGKGGTAVNRGYDTEISGVIRRALPTWLADPSIASFVSHYTNAHPKHGGDGAWYVFVRAQSRLKRK